MAKSNNKVYGGSGGANMDEARAKIRKAVRNRKVQRQDGYEDNSIFTTPPNPDGDEEDDDESGSSPTSEEESAADNAASEDAAPPPPPPQAGVAVDEQTLREIVRSEMSQAHDGDAEEDTRPAWARTMEERFTPEQLQLLAEAPTEIADMLGGEPMPVTWHRNGANQVSIFDVVEFYWKQGDTTAARVILKSRPERQSLVPDPGETLQCTIDGERYGVKMSQAAPGQADIIGWTTALMVVKTLDSLEDQQGNP